MLDHAVPDRIPKWKLDRADWSEFRRICNIELQPSVFENTRDDPMEVFTSVLHFIAEITIPKTSTIAKKKNKPWWDEDCQSALNSRKRALRIFRKHPTQDSLIKYKHEYAKARKTMRKAMKSSWEQYVSKLNNRTPMKKVWDMVGKITGKRRYCGIQQIKYDDQYVTGNTDIANVIGYTISKNSASANYSHKFQSVKLCEERKTLNLRSRNNEYYNKPFSLSELRESLKRAHDTACGPDEIHYQLLKHLPDAALQTLLNIFNDIWLGGSFPACWRQAIVIPIAKPGKDPTNPGNYRPIALTSCLCKTMERMVNDRLVYYLETNNIITEFQSGFRKNRSTTDQLVRLETAVREAFINRQHLVAIFFDLEKAYDTTWRYGIMKDLHDAGLRGHMPSFIARFLSDRIFSVRLGTSFSDLFDQEEGVPQGSILSVTLFSMKINSIVGNLSSGVNCSLYVDDFLMCYSSTQMHTIERQLQQCLNRIEHWADSNGFRFSKTKTVCMHFCNLRRLHPEPELKLYGSAIPLVEQFKFLGVIFDKKLSFMGHIKYIKTKCQKALNLIKVVSHMNWGADRDVLLRLYRALVRSKLDYGSIVYGSARPSYIKALDTIHNQGLRLCLGAFRTSPMESLYVEANEPSLYRRREKLSLQYAIKLKSIIRNPAHAVAFKPNNVNKFNARPSAIPPFGIRIQRLMEDMNIQINTIAESKLSLVPPWELALPNVNMSCKIGKKTSTNPYDFLSKFYELTNMYSEFNFIYTDGSKSGDKVGCAAVTSGGPCKMRLPDRCSVYTAELQAIKIALVQIKESTHNAFVICSDSLSALQAIEYRDINHPLVLDILTEHHSLLRRSGKVIMFLWVPSHVGIPGNDRADRAAKAALDLDVSFCRIPYTDFRPVIHTYVYATWQSFWDGQFENKLHKAKPNLGTCAPIYDMSRRDQLVMARTRIGHTYLTQGYLLRGEEAPVCVPCRERLTVEHILIQCTEFEDIRQRFYECENLNDLFSSYNIYCILNFLREIGVYFYF